jgi:hypothetical protein
MAGFAHCKPDIGEWVRDAGHAAATDGINKQGTQ